MKQTIGKQIKKERTRQNFTQEELIQKAQLNWDRQTLGQIENGERELRAWELAQIAQVLRVEMSQFFPSVPKETTQPFVLWRQRPQNHQRLEAGFIQLCKDYKLVEDLNAVEQDRFHQLPRKQIHLTSFNHADAYALAEEVRSALDLGNYPASSLVKTLEERYGIKFFFNALDGNGSAASSVSKYGSCILISSSEPPWRQHFSIAHELFHIITWNEALLDQINSDPALWGRNEKLADAFAAGLLVPSEALGHEIRLVSKDGKLTDAGIVALARQFGVSLEALLWRMVGLFIIQKKNLEDILSHPQLRTLDQESRFKTATPYYFHSRFVRLAYMAYENGEISRARLAKMLGTTLSGLTRFLNQFGLIEVGDHEIPLSHP